MFLPHYSALRVLGAVLISSLVDSQKIHAGLHHLLFGHVQHAPHQSGACTYSPWNCDWVLSPVHTDHTLISSIIPTTPMWQVLCTRTWTRGPIVFPITEVFLSQRCSYHRGVPITEVGTFC
ncbi:hypothetical protein BJ875DRAFT_65130 [Amylocarpus encephaloides]|uniref:Secreted protein n=1 Tax=Amylocarpus encephaloides TaxID=45428 RepID=A0A9P8C3S1_9HELO|nr:hypothetical protein BJ875DRAFT_65130 [Amylocarpus encephaloides]